MSVVTASAVLVLLCLLVIGSRSQPTSTIRFIDHSYRKYVGRQDPQHPWHDKTDIISKRGFSMVPVQADISDQAVTLINTSLGVVGLSAATPFTFQDFYQAYQLPTIWPYCESATKCLVYSQASSPQRKEPITLCMPPGISAVDLYIDAAIDCVETMRAVVSCRVVAHGSSGSVDVEIKVKSICASPFVGQYIGFLDECGDIESLTITCKSSYPNALGLVRIGNKRPPSAAVL